MSRPNQQRFSIGRQDTGVRGHHTNIDPSCGAAGGGVAGGIWGGHGNRGASGRLPHHLWCQRAQKVSWLMRKRPISAILD